MCAATMRSVKQYMEAPSWYELRIEGSAGTAVGAAQQETTGLVIGADGRLTSISSGHPMRFRSEQEAIAYLMANSLARLYPFAVVPIDGRGD
jgi:hypothetical protein